MMDDHSEALLAHVHPDLAKVMRAAAQTPQPFQIVYGIRTLAAEEQAVATGHSTTLHSRHLPDKGYATPENPDGVACAVDVAALINGQISFAPGEEEQVFGKIAAQVKAAALELNILVEWGGNWRSFKDWGHYQLPWKQYP
jgi:peptidoglycan L-alanyl-D-glutamate endopeptidase CwlK